MQMYEDEDFEELPLAKFESMLKTNKILFFDSEEFEGIIIHYLDEGKVSLAKKALKLALEQHPNSTGLRLVQVEILIYGSKFEMAEKMLNELQSIEPTNEEIYIQRANIYSRKNQHDKAVIELQTALQYTDDLSDVYSLMGMEYLYLDNLESAKDSFIKCLEDDEDDEDHSTLFNVIYCFDFLDQNQQAITFLKNYIDKNPYSEVAWHQLGREYYIEKEYHLALEAFDYATLIDERFVGAYMEKGKSLEKLGKFKKAIKNYLITLELEDPTPFALLRIGKCYEKLGKKVLALEYFLKATNEDPLLQKGWLAIIKFYIKETDYEKALYYTNKALGIDQENAKFWMMYAKINKTLQYYEESIIGFNNALENGEYKLKSWLALADTLIEIGEYKTAIEALEKCSEFYPEKAQIAYRLSGLSYLLKNTDNCLKHLKNALSLKFNKHILLQSLFPQMWESETIQQIISGYRG